MKSRAILLAAMLFALPVFGEESQEGQGEPTAQGQQAGSPSEGTDKDKGTSASDVSTFSKIRDCAAVPFVALAAAPDWVAEQTLGRLAKIEYLKGGKVAAFLSNPWTGRTAFGLIVLVAALKTYQRLTADTDEVDAGDDERIFGAN